MKNNLFKKLTALLIMISLIMMNFAAPENVNAANKKYGIVITDKSGIYTFYDLNNSTNGISSIEISASGNIMVPLRKLVKLLPVLSYTYNSAKNTATIVNTSNGKKIVYSKNSSYLYYYSSSKAKAVKVTMPYKMYISKTSSSVMVHMSSLKWVLQSTGGCKYYTTASMQTAGYDTSVYSGLILYNPYKTVTTIPTATKVTGISSTIKVTIPEGYSVAQTFDLLVKKGVCASTASLYDAMENYDFTYYPLVSEIEENTNRCFKLEGYLYPDTYEFYRLSKPQDVIGKFLRDTEARITTTYRDRATAMGYSMNEILTIASIIEKETADKTMMPTIASVIYNRLNIKMKLEFDSSIYYVERYIKPYISGDTNRYNSFYNTYKCAALPAGPICNPGKAAIEAALYPATTDYLYFYSDTNGEYHFSKEYVDPNSTGSTDTAGATDTSGSTNTAGAADTSGSTNTAGTTGVSGSTD